MEEKERGGGGRTAWIIDSMFPLPECGKGKRDRTEGEKTEGEGRRSRQLWEVEGRRREEDMGNGVEEGIERCVCTILGYDMRKRLRRGFPYVDCLVEVLSDKEGKFNGGVWEREEEGG